MIQNRSICYRIDSSDLSSVRRRAPARCRARLAQQRYRRLVIDPHLIALVDAKPKCFWLDQPDRPPMRPPLVGDERADLLIVGGGFTGLWAAVQAKERDPERDIVLIEADTVAEGASGRNGGFAASSLTHGLSNGLHHFPDEMQTLEELASENYRGYLAALERYGIDARLEESGALDVATEAYQVEELREYFDLLQRFGEAADWFDRDAVRSQLDSPTYHAGVWRHSGSILDPARVAWGLRDAALRLGVRIYEQTSAVDLKASNHGIRVSTGAGCVDAGKVVLATNAFRSPLRSMRRSVIAVWDYALMSEPLSEAQLHSIGWKQRQGVGDTANQFHYYRLTADNRILWGGYDAVYHFGNRVLPEYQQHPGSFEGLSRRFFATFPQLEGLRFTHTWGGPIATTTRFCMDVGTGYRGLVSWAMGYTGLGVVASRFGARAALDLLDQPDAPHLALRLLRKRAFPWPPEPICSAAVELTQRGLAKADRNEGRRGPWLLLLDSLGLGFDS
jgi:glycine/D-amino acid oxidase-like deaminating enzyme